MKPVVIFMPAAREELLAAEDWYETQSAGLGTAFLDEVEATVSRMVSNAYQFPVVFEDLRRARLHKFPYALFFRLDTDLLTIFACFHGSRDPQRWQQRV